MDLCGFRFREVERTRQLLRVYMGDAYMGGEQGTKLKPVDVRGLCGELRGEGIAYGGV